MLGKESKLLSRQHLANPWANISLRDRLIASGAVDMRDNFRVIDLENGYVDIVPIDPNKKWTKESIN